jgi:hypothetical protein
MKFNIIDIQYELDIDMIPKLDNQIVTITVAKLVKIYNSKARDSKNENGSIIFEFITEDKKPYFISIKIPKDPTKFYMTDIMQSIWNEVEDIYDDELTNIVDEDMFRNIVDKAFDK